MSFEKDNSFFYYKDFISSKPLISDWQWVAGWLEMQKKYVPVEPLQLPEHEITIEAVSLLNRRIRRLQTNLAILDRGCYAVKTAGQAKLVWKEIMRQRERLEEAKHYLRIARQKLGVHEDE